MKQTVIEILLRDTILNRTGEVQVILDNSAAIITSAEGIRAAIERAARVDGVIIQHSRIFVREVEIDPEPEIGGEG